MSKAIEVQGVSLTPEAVDTLLGWQKNGYGAANIESMRKLSDYLVYLSSEVDENEYKAILYYQQQLCWLRDDIARIVGVANATFG